MSAKTNPTEKVRKSALKDPGEISGPMCLPVSYNTKDYKVRSIGGPDGKLKSLKPVRRRANSGASRYKTSKLISQEPIE